MDFAINLHLYQSQSQSQIYFIQDQEIHYLQSVGYEN